MRLFCLHDCSTAPLRMECYDDGARARQRAEAKDQPREIPFRGAMHFCLRGSLDDCCMRNNIITESRCDAVTFSLHRQKDQRDGSFSSLLFLLILRQFT